jgi:uncharacterized membrane protein
LIVLQILFLLFFPFLLMKLCTKYKKIKVLSPILLCYLTGIILGNIKTIPLDRDFSMTVSEISVMLAIPMILFSTDFKGWLKLAKTTVISFCLVIVSVIVSSAAAFLVFSNQVDNADIISGMLTGVYTGGTPNLIAIGMGLHIPESTLILVNTSDAIIGGLYFLFLISIGKWLLGKFLPRFSRPSDMETEDFGDIESAPNKSIIFVLILALLFVGISIGISMLITGSMEVGIIMLAVTTLGIAASFNKKIRNTKGTYKTGQYIIYVFSLAIGTTVNVKEILNANLTIFFYTLFVMIGAILLHLLLATILRIDRDTTIITSTAGIYGPAFIIPVANAINNRHVILSGLMTGLVGYAVGNYLGYLIALIL